MRAIAALVASLVAIGCKAGAGSSCERGEARCLNRETQLICSSGKLIATPCRGDQGCRLTPGGVACDISKNQHGDVCSLDEEASAICASRDRILTCSQGRLTLGDCRGPSGCETVGGRAKCDKTLANAGDACRPADKACTLDGKQLLTCRDGKLAVAFFCLGPGGCKVTGGKLDCDLSIARDEDPCDKEMEGKFACNIDERSIVACKRGKFVIDTRCKPGESCSTEGGIACQKATK